MKTKTNCTVAAAVKRRLIMAPSIRLRTFREITRRLTAAATTVAVLSAVAFPFTCLAQGFDSGSDGSMGALFLNGDTNLVVPPDGKFHFTTITVGSGRTLRFTRNALNTPVYLLATSNVLIQGTVNVDGGAATESGGGVGGAGGFDGATPNGGGHGPGGGHPGLNVNSSAGAGSGVYSRQPLNTEEASTNKGSAYGSPLLVPMVGGSGGGGRTDFGGGGGGGGIVIASSTRIDLVGSGQISARGGFAVLAVGAALNYGSGGGVRLLANTVAGNGTIDVRGGNSHKNFGRVRIDSIDRSGIAFNVPTDNTSIPPPLSIGAYMTVFPPGNPRLDIIEVAGVPIPEGTNSPVIITLPFGSDPARKVIVQARDFNELFTVTMNLTPQSGRRIGVPSLILLDNSAANPATVEVNVAFPINTPVAVNVWRQ